MAKKKKHGGKRKRTGRKVGNPAEGDAIIVHASVPKGLIEKLDRLSLGHGWLRSQAIAEAVRRLVRKA
jgi:hypothetical protein